MMQTTKMNKKFMEGIEKCASLYGFSVDDAIAKIIESKKKVKIVAPKASFALPFSGEKNGKCCEGLRYNDGLYTQCEVLKKGENKFCAVCEKLRPLTLIDDGHDGISACEECEDGVRHYLGLER